MKLSRISFAEEEDNLSQTTSLPSPNSGPEVYRLVHSKQPVINDTATYIGARSSGRSMKESVLCSCCFREML